MSRKYSEPTARATQGRRETPRVSTPEARPAFRVGFQAWRELVCLDFDGEGWWDCAEESCKRRGVGLDVVVKASRRALGKVRVEPVVAPCSESRSSFSMSARACDVECRGAGAGVEQRARDVAECAFGGRRNQIQHCLPQWREERLTEGTEHLIQKKNSKSSPGETRTRDGHEFV